VPDAGDEAVTEDLEVAAVTEAVVEGELDGGETVTEAEELEEATEEVAVEAVAEELQETPSDDTARGDR
jgi:hypothetical protein